MELQKSSDDEKMPKLESLTLEAVVHLRREQKDQFSFWELIPDNYFDIINSRIFTAIGVEDLPNYVGYDKSAPLGDETQDVVQISNLVCDKAAEMYPHAENLRILLAKWKELEDACLEIGHRRKRLSDIVHMKKELYAFMAAKTESEVSALQKVFLEARESLDSSSLESVRFMPRYVARIYMREDDGHRRGEIQKREDGQDKRNGSFVAAWVNSSTCFNRIVFTLGLKPGYHVLAGCGGSGKNNQNSNLFALQNIRMMLRNKEHRQGRYSFEDWAPLYAETYDRANRTVELNNAEMKDSGESTLPDLWFSKNNSKVKVKEPDIWVTGEELEKVLGQPDSEFRHTVRAIAIRKNVCTQEMEILTVVERGDNPLKRTGKPPAWGLPGGMREKDITLKDTLCRETQNEAQTHAVTKVIALVAKQKKQKRKDAVQENIDWWFLVETDREAGLSRNLIESDEIYSVQWVPLAELSQFGFQHTRQGSPTVWDVKKVHEQKLMYPNHAAKLIEILPRIPGIVLPENFRQFKDNLEKFKKESR